MNLLRLTALGVIVSLCSCAITAPVAKVSVQRVGDSYPFAEVRTNGEVFVAWMDGGELNFSLDTEGLLASVVPPMDKTITLASGGLVTWKKGEERETRIPILDLGISGVVKAGEAVSPATGEKQTVFATAVRQKYPIDVEQRIEVYVLDPDFEELFDEWEQPHSTAILLFSNDKELVKEDLKTRIMQVHEAQLPGSDSAEPEPIGETTEGP